MSKNAKDTEVFTSSEAIQMCLAKNLGRGKAHDLINDLKNYKFEKVFIFN